MARSTERRIGAEGSESRAALLDAAQALMVEEGYASVSSRRVAAQAGLKPQLVHYYFRTMDDLFLALFRGQAEIGLERQARALAGDQPLWAYWAYATEPAGTALAVEFNALARHRPAIRAEIAEFAARFRREQVAVLDAVLLGYGLDPAELPALAVVVHLTAMSRFLSMEEGLGMDLGHAEARAAVERWITSLEGPRPAR